MLPKLAPLDNTQLICPLQTIFCCSKWRTPHNRKESIQIQISNTLSSDGHFGENTWLIFRNLYYLAVLHIGNSWKRQSFNKVNPWTTRGWTAQVHLHVNFFIQYSKCISSYDFLNIFFSLFYYKNAVYNTYTKYVLITYVIGKAVSS